MSFNSFAPVLSAQVSREPTGRPRAILGLYSTMPRALTARVFGAGMFTLLLLSYLLRRTKLPCLAACIPLWSLGRLLSRLCREGCGRGAGFFASRICYILDNSANRLALPTQFSEALKLKLFVRRPLLSPIAFRGIGRRDRCTRNLG